MTRAIVFDLDGTLIDSMPDIASAVNTVLASEGVAALDLPTVTGFVGEGLPKLMDRVISHTGLSPDDHARLTRDTLALYMASDGTKTRLYPGVLDALNALQAAGFVMGVCTNKPENAAHHNLALQGLAPFFDAVIGGDTLPVRKPDPTPLTTCFDQLGATQMLYVGDSETDAATARQAGIRFALYTLGYRKTPVAEIPHDVAFSDFSDLFAIAQDH